MKKNKNIFMASVLLLSRRLNLQPVHSIRLKKMLIVL